MVRALPKSLAASFAILFAASPGISAPASAQDSSAKPPNVTPSFHPAERTVSTWREEAASSLILTPDQVAALRAAGAAPRVARCVKLNNYWCIKKAGWDGEIAADGEGHVAFASAVEGAAVAALLLKRYYVDFDRKSAMAIISRWAPAQCGGLVAGNTRPRRSGKTSLTQIGLGGTLRARWLASLSRGFVTPVAGRRSLVRRSIVADHVSRAMPTPTIAAGLDLSKPAKPMTLDALLKASPNAPPSRSMLGMPRTGGGRAAIAQLGSLSSCAGDSARIAAYAAKAAAGITPGPKGDLLLFAADGTPTANLGLMMANMARVEIGPLGATPALVAAGIAEAFRPGRNPGSP